MSLVVAAGNSFSSSSSTTSTSHGSNEDTDSSKRDSEIHINSQSKVVASLQPIFMSCRAQIPEGVSALKRQ